MGKTAVLLMIITIFSKVLGFARDITLSYFYGASNISDAYLISITIPITIFGFIGAGIATGYIPMYSKIESDYKEEEATKYTNNLINILLVICTVIIIIGLLFTNQIVKIFASGFEGETLILAIKFTKISLLGVYFTGLISIFSGYLEIKGNYSVPALIAFPANIIFIISIFISYNTSSLVLAIGSVIATVSQLLLMIPFVYRKGYRYKFILDIKDKHIINMAYIALPIIIGVSINQINVIIDRTLASAIVVGGISALNYANKLNLFVHGMFVATIATAMYPMTSKMAAEKNIDGLRKVLLESLNIISLLVIPSTVGAMMFAKPIVQLLFGRGAFDSKSLILTSSALLFYSIGMIGVGFREVISRSFYSLQDTKTPMINSILAMFINIILNLILSKYMGISGIALATSISSIFCTVILLISFRKKIVSFSFKKIGIPFLKISCASVFMGVTAKLLYEILLKFTNVNLSLIASISAGSIIYFVIIYFMKIEEVETILNTLKSKIKRIN